MAVTGEVAMSGNDLSLEGDTRGALGRRTRPNESGTKARFMHKLWYDGDRYFDVVLSGGG